MEMQSTAAWSARPSGSERPPRTQVVLHHSDPFWGSGGRGRKPATLDFRRGLPTHRFGIRAFGPGFPEYQPLNALLDILRDVNFARSFAILRFAILR
jgi:hypothetical protein